jgi:hypothetical protein
VEETNWGDRFGTSLAGIAAPYPLVSHLPEISEHAHYGIDITSVFCALQEIVVNFHSTRT